MSRNERNLIRAIKYNYDNAEDVPDAEILLYWKALKTLSFETEPRRAFEHLHESLPFEANSSLSPSLRGWDVYNQTEALVELLEQAQADTEE